VQADYRLVNVALCRRRIPIQGLPQLASVDPEPPPVEDVPGQGVESLDLSKPRRIRLCNSDSEKYIVH
jgi:hypothetical protein